MDQVRIAELLAPFLAAGPLTGRKPLSLAASQLKQISTYIDILSRWNTRINLTAIRRPEEIVTRHFGESLFAASHLFPKPHTQATTPQEGQDQTADPAPPHPPHVVDIGSGAGFPGLPIKIWEPDISLTLIESNHKKATFLREVGRALRLTNVNVFPGRAQDFRAKPQSMLPTRDPASPLIETAAQVVTLRAVERFDSILPIAATLLAPAGQLALLIGDSQVAQAQNLLPSLTWCQPIPIPGSDKRMLVIGKQEPRK